MTEIQPLNYLLNMNIRLSILSISSILLLVSACAPAPVLPVDKKPLMDAHVKTITQARRRVLMARIEKEATGISTGTGAPNKAFVFFDPQCSYCSDLWRKTQSLKDQVDFVWVLVGTLSEDRTCLSASILDAADPAALLSENAESMKTTGTPIKVKSAPSEAALSKVAVNTELFRNLDPAAPIQATPMMYYRSANGHVELILGSMDAAALKAALQLN